MHDDMVDAFSYAMLRRFLLFARPDYLERLEAMTLHHIDLSLLDLCEEVSELQYQRELCLDTQFTRFPTIIPPPYWIINATT